MHIAVELHMMRLQPDVLCLVVFLTAIAGCGETPGDGQNPTIERIDPPRGPLAGGNEIRITGTGFSEAAPDVVVGGERATDLVVLEDGSLRVKVPAGQQAGNVDVIITTRGGLTYLREGYSYNPLPVVSAVVPDRGSYAGAPVSLVGTGFLDYEAGDALVRIGGEACLDVSVQSDTIIVCNAPGGPAWSLADVEMENHNGVAHVDDAFGYMKVGLLAVEGRGGIAGTLYFVDTEDATVRAVAPVSTAITGLASHTDGTLYGVSSNGIGVSAGFPRQLVSIDPFTGTVAELGPLLRAGGEAAKIPDITMDYVGNVLYGWSRSDDQLVTINIKTGEVTLQGGNRRPRGGGLALDLDGELYLAPDGSDGELYRVALGDGELLSVADLVDSAGDDINSMAFLGDTLYGIREGLSLDGTTKATTLLEIDMQTGAVTSVLDMPFGADALAATPPLPFM